MDIEELKEDIVWSRSLKDDSLGVQLMPVVTLTHRELQIKLVLRQSTKYDASKVLEKAFECIVSEMNKDKG